MNEHVGRVSGHEAARTEVFAHTIDGEREMRGEHGTLDVVCPSDGLSFATIPRGGAADVDRAVRAARRAFEGEWGQVPAVERGRMLMRLSQAVGERADELAALESRDTGKPLAQGRADIAALARYLEFYAGGADKVHGETIPIAGDHLALTLREPHGVVAGIIPWNYPAQILGRVAGAALAMGNALVVKPAEDACLSVLRVAELAAAILPSGAFNVVSGLGREAGAALAAHADVDFVTFTGSPATGTAIAEAAAVNNRGTTMELGGKSPQIVFADADMDAALPVIVNAIVQNGGQTCSAGSRVLIERAAYDDVTARLAAAFRELEAGPHDGDHRLGALINERQHARVTRMCERARAAGARVLAEGRVADEAPPGGYYHAPVLFGDVDAGSEMGREEVFGPVLAAFAFDTEDEAVRLANGTDYALVAGVWTNGARRSVRVAKRVRAGQVYSNGYGAGGGIELPFGGFGRSGHGREKGFEGMVHMSATKTIVLGHGEA